MLRFDTRNKKPKVYNIAILSVSAFVILVILLTRPAVSYLPVAWVLGIYLALVIVCLLAAFVMQVQYNPYSYNTIYYPGFALFLFTVLISLILVTVQAGREQMGDPGGVLNLFSILLGSARTYMLISLPFIVFYSAALCISNISLIRHEGKRLVNILGIILSVILLAGEAILYFANYYTYGSLEEVMIHDLLVNLFAALYLYFECMLIGSILANILVVRYEPEKNKDFLIILGCGLWEDGTPTPLLAGRIDRAVQFYRGQQEQTGRGPILIPSGGRGPDEAVAESTAMKRYLLEKGIPEEQIREEDRSRSTYENMLFSKEIIRSIDPNGKIAFSTTNYHIFRSGLMARRVKMRAVGIGARTKWYFWPNAAVREFAGLLTEHRLKQGLILGGMIAIYVVFTILIYQV